MVMIAGLAQCQGRLWALVTPPGWASSTTWWGGQEKVTCQPLMVVGGGREHCIKGRQVQPKSMKVDWLCGGLIADVYGGEW